MANNLTDNPWIIDTASANVLYSSKIKVRHFEFSNYAVQANQAIVKDKNGRVIWDPTGADDLEEVRSAAVGWISGLIVSQLDGGGVLRVYYE